MIKRTTRAAIAGSSGTAFDATGAGHAKLRVRWWVVVGLCVIVGVWASIIAASSIASSDAHKSRAAFTTSSGEVASTLQLAIHDEESLVINASSFLIERPDAANADLARWLSQTRAFERYPELVSLGFAVVVPASELAAFAAGAVADPSGPLSSDGTFEVIPGGDRASYCFPALLQTPNNEKRPPAGVDYCADAKVREVFDTARDTGAGSYAPLAAALGGGLIVQVPLYSTGSAPLTVPERRAAFLGTVGIQVNSALVLERALAGHAGMAVSLRFHDRYSDAQFSAGFVGDGAMSTVIDLGNGWTVQTSAVVPSGAVWTNSASVVLLAAGVALTALLAAFGLVLATGRARALQLVEERTGELRHQALHDALTGLPNRALIIDRIEQLLARNRRHGTSGAALFIDLDDFKNVNDTLGHEAGDRLLMAVTARLISTLRDVDTIGRMGGDEFVVLIDGATMQAGPELVAERLLEVMRQPFVLEGATMPLTVNASIGLACGDRATPGDLLRDADVALYQAKAAGKNCFEVFHAEMQSEIIRRVELQFDLRSALASDQFHLVYQPIYNLEDLTLVGVEALLRWHHPVLGVIQPDDFIPILEQTGQIQAVGRWVLSHACEQMAAWHASGDTLDISVNVSGRQLDHDGVIDDIRAALAVSGLDPNTLIVEVTETALMRNTEDTARRLHAIKELGVRIAVDDFGTGYSSLAYLQSFPVDCLKIDRTFTSAISTSPESKALIGTLVQLGRDLGLQTLAEGVETTGQIDHMRGEHVTQAQGFLLSRPLDAHTLETQLLIPTRVTQANRPSSG